MGGIRRAKGETMKERVIPVTGLKFKRYRVGPDTVSAKVDLDGNLYILSRIVGTDPTGRPLPSRYSTIIKRIETTESPPKRKPIPTFATNGPRGRVIFTTE